MKLPVRSVAQQRAESVESCDTCRYYREFSPEELEEMEDEPEAVTGNCRRYPPVVLPGAAAASVYPEVSAKIGWCGEFTPRT